ncbi:MAG TPA: hypothetical protein VLM16_08940 [Ginsengibacter sp.]|nr:hypothetical protein [Ginsengibacter sp.]
MSTCNFSIPFSGPAESILAKAKAAVESQNGDFNGDIHSGSFEVSVFGNLIRGSYNVSAQTLNLMISDKPFLIPCSTIESFLKSRIS